jgi:tetratricopeptide (TPR) repeat protein
MPISHFSGEGLNGAAYRAYKHYRLDQTRHQRYSEHDSSTPLVGCNSVVRNIPSIFHLAVKFPTFFGGYMPNVSLPAGLRAAALISISLIAGAGAWGQTFSSSPYDRTRMFGYSSRGLIELEENMPTMPDPREGVPSGPPTISADALRHPLSTKARRRLQKALHLSELGEHPAAIQELRETLMKEPSSAPYAHSLLGVEYVQSQQFAEARTSFEEAVRLMPHESVNHSNLGFSLAVAGDWSSAEREARTAIQLDPANSRAKTLLDIVLHARRATKR